MQEEDQVDAHLGDRQHQQRHRNARPPDERRAHKEERNGGNKSGQEKPDNIAEKAFGDFVAARRLVAGRMV